MNGYLHSAVERLQSLRVADAMTRRVIVVRPEASMTEAARTLTDFSVSGTPVVDAAGACVGMLSAVDFVRGRAQHGEGDPPVQDRMTSAVQTIRADDALLQAARVMCAQHIHRLPVLDEKAHVVGILTSLDLVSALVKAMEEE